MYAEGASVAAIGRAMEINEATALVRVKKALSSAWIMDAERSERKPAASGVPASARKIRGINADKPEVKTVSFDEMWTRVGARRGKKRRSALIRTAAVERNGSSSVFGLAGFPVAAKSASRAKRDPENPANLVNPDFWQRRAVFHRVPLGCGAHRNDKSQTCPR